PPPTPPSLRRPPTRSCDRRAGGSVGRPGPPSRRAVGRTGPPSRRAVGRAGPSGGRVRRADGAAERAGPSGGRGRRAGGSVGLYDAPGRQPGGGRGENALHSAAAGYMAAASLQSAFSPHRNHGSSSAEPADPPQGAPRGGRVVSRRP